MRELYIGLCIMLTYVLSKGIDRSVTANGVVSVVLGSYLISVAVCLWKDIPNKEGE